jgi:acyl-coenzyme A thioesterase PaaI-like protein
MTDASGSHRRPDPVQEVKQRRDAALKALVTGVPYIQYLGVEFDRRGDEITSILRFDEKLIGNSALPALHGGVIAAFLEITAIIELSQSLILATLEAGKLPSLPKTIDFTVDYLRSGLPRDAYARARVARAGRRYASVNVEAWQDNRARLFTQANGHFLMPERAALDET